MSTVLDLKSQGYTAQRLKNEGFVLSEINKYNVLFYFRDTYGDGWNSGSITIKNKNTGQVVTTLNGPPLATKNWNSSVGILSVNTTYETTKVGGIYPSEIYYAITLNTQTQYNNTTTSINFGTNVFLGQSTNPVSSFNVGTYLLYPISELKAAGYTDTEIKNGGYTIADFKAAGYNYTDVQLKAIGFTVAEFKALGYTIAQLKAIGYTDTEIKNGGYTVVDFKAAGYTDVQLKASGFTDNEIRFIYLISEGTEKFIFVDVGSTTIMTSSDETYYNIDVTGKNMKYFNFSSNSYTPYTTIRISSNGWIGFTSSISEYNYGTSNQQPINTLRYLSFDAKSTIKYYFDSNGNLLISTIGSYYGSSLLSFTIVIKIQINGKITIDYKNIGPSATDYKPKIGWVGNDINSLNDSVFYSTFDGVQVYNQGNINGKTLIFNFTNDVIIANICFAFGTPVTTDQGNIPIQDINNEYHTINNKKLVCITKTVSTDKNLVCFETNSIGNNVPNNRTIMSQGHGIYIDDKLFRANDLVNNKSIYKIEYNEEILYNILMECHEKISINNMICETLDPTNYVSRLYNIMDNSDYLDKIKLINMMNLMQM